MNLAILVIPFVVIVLTHMGMSFSIQGLFGKIRDSHPKYKREFDPWKAQFLNTPKKVERILTLCREIKTEDSLRLAKLIQIDNIILGVGVVLVLSFGITNMILETK